MNNKKVRRLMLELNKIRGGMDMFSMIRLVGYFGLILKAETDKQEGVYDDKYSSAYLAFTYGGLVGPDELAAYLESLEAAYHIPIRMVSVEVLSILSDADRQMISRLFHILSELEVTGSSIAEFYDDFFEAAYSRLGKSSGRISVNRSFARLVGALARTEEGMTLYDGFCGEGSLILAADNGCRLFMQDMDMLSIGMAAVNAVIHGKDPEVIRSADPFMNPPLSHGEKFDRIVSTPPIGMRVANDYLYEACRVNYIDPSLASGDSIAVSQMLGQLKEDGIGIVQVPMGFLFKGGKVERLRRYMVENNLLDCVVEIPSGVLNNSSIVTALLVLRKQKKDRHVFFIDSSELWDRILHKGTFLSEEGLREITSLYEERKKTEKSRYVDVETIISNECKLTPKFYMTESIEVEIEDIGMLKSRADDAYKRFMEVNDFLNKLREEKGESK